MNFLLIISEWSGKVVCESGKYVFDFLFVLVFDISLKHPSFTAEVSWSTCSDCLQTEQISENLMTAPATTVSLPKLCVTMPVRTQNHPFLTVSDPSGTPRTHLGPAKDPCW